MCIRDRSAPLQGCEQEEVVSPIDSSWDILSLRYGRSGRPCGQHQIKKDRNNSSQNTTSRNLRPLPSVNDSPSSSLRLILRAYLVACIAHNHTLTTLRTDILTPNKHMAHRDKSSGEDPAAQRSDQAHLIRSILHPEGHNSTIAHRLSTVASVALVVKYSATTG